MKNKWHGTPPTKCDICNNKLEGAFVDGMVDNKKLDTDFLAPWAIMCIECHKGFGVGLGIGKGQKYSMKVIKGGGKEWIKVKKSH